MCRQGWEPLWYGTGLFAKVRKVWNRQKEAMHDKEIGIQFDNKDCILIQKKKKNKE